MPFKFLLGRRGNLAMLLVLFVLVLGLICTLAALAYALDRKDPQRLEFYKIIGICTVVLGQIALLIRSQTSDAYLHKTSHDIRGAVGAATLEVQAATKELAAKTNGNLDDRIKTICAEVRQAEHDQMLPEMLKSPELHQLIKDVAVELCSELQNEGERRIDRPPFKPGGTIT